MADFDSLPFTAEDFYFTFKWQVQIDMSFSAFISLGQIVSKDFWIKNG